MTPIGNRVICASGPVAALLVHFGPPPAEPLHPARVYEPEEDDDDRGQVAGTDVADVVDALPCEQRLALRGAEGHPQRVVGRVEHRVQPEEFSEVAARGGDQQQLLAVRHDAPSSEASGAIAGSSAGGWLGGATNLASSFAASIATGTSTDASARSTPKTMSFTSGDELLLDDTEDDEDELELSASQIMQFETENATLLQNVQDTLQSVQQAESRLLEISALQAELVAHLTKQTEQTEQLYEDAIATAATVEKGNAQLKEARRRARDSRKWILLFLIGASLSLLFLHYY